MNEKINYKFSGHETFNCRPIWLKKGYDFANSRKDVPGNIFGADEAVVELGVGKNMVASIKFWLRAFGFFNLHSNQLEGLAKDILDNDGYDPFLEDDATLYLLHYLLVENIKTSSIYNLSFTKFVKEKLEFTTEDLLTFLRRKCSDEEVEFNIKTVKNDINVFLKNYLPIVDKKLGIEDNYNGLFYDLRFISKFKSSEGETKYRFNINDGKNLPEVIFLYAILDKFPGEVSISLNAIRDNVSTTFLMEKQGTFLLIQRLVETYPELITFKDDGGRQELQFKKEIDKNELLANYYESI